MKNLAFAHRANIIAGESEHGGGISLSSDEFDLKAICRIAVNHCSNVALLQVVFLDVSREDNYVQFFNHVSPFRCGIRLDRL